MKNLLLARLPFFLVCCGVTTTGTLPVLATTTLAASITSTPTLAPPFTQWDKLPGTSGLPERGMQAAYDSNRKVIVVFGGTGAGNHTISDTWEFNGTSWKKVKVPNSPPARFWNGMAYDSDRRVVVLFGGDSEVAEYNGKSLNDTWEYYGANWVEVKTVHAPKPRGNGVLLVYDNCRQVTVMFGGSEENGLSNITWEYDGRDWTQSAANANPVGRSLSAMAFDSLRCKTVLFGGGHNAEVLNDTWEYNGQIWERMKPANKPPAMWGHAMAFNAASGYVVLYGGYKEGGLLLGETWAYDGATWQEYIHKY